MHDLMKCLKNYRFHSIFFRNLTLVLTVMMLPCFGILSISYFGYRQIQKSESVAYSEELLTRVSHEVNGIFEGMKEKMGILLLRGNFDSFFIQADMNGISLTGIQQNVKEISIYKSAIDILSDIYIYAPANGSIITANSIHSYEMFDDKEIVDYWQKCKKSFQIKYQKRQVGEKQKQNICLYYIVYYSANRKGVCVFSIDMNALSDELNYGDQVRVFITNEGQVLYDSIGEYNGETIGETQHLEEQIEGKYVVSRQLEKSSLKVILHIDDSPVHEKLAGIRRMIFGYVGIMTLVTLILVVYISQKMFAPFSEIMKALKGDVTHINNKEILQDINELGYIKQTIFDTMSKKKNVEEELKERIEMLRKAQAVALQAQINPHFINNALVNISWKMSACMGKGNEVTQMVDALASLLKLSLGNVDTFVTLREEVEYVQKYLLIQRKLLGDRFDVEVEIQDEIKECKLIKLLLQPVVENAIKYGIKPFETRGLLKITAVLKENVVCISVSDTGLGLMPEEVDEINRSIRGSVIKENDHIGLSNVTQRIVLTFGEDYGVTVKSKIGTGTTVEIEVPFQI